MLRPSVALSDTALPAPTVAMTPGAAGDRRLDRLAIDRELARCQRRGRDTARDVGDIAGAESRRACARQTGDGDGLSGVGTDLELLCSEGAIEQVETVELRLRGDT